MSVRRLMTMALVWLVIVAGASTLTWAVISSVGTRVGQPVVVATPDTDSPSGGPLQPAKTWTGKAGKVSARCAGESISLGSAVPNVGYWVKVHEQGPERLRLDFEATGTGDDDTRETRLVATCVEGSPVFLHA